MVAPEVAERCQREGTVPLLRDAYGRPLKRNFVHVSDLVRAILAALGNPVTRGRTYNIAMTDPVDYGVVAAHLAETRGLPSVDIASDYHSVCLDNARARTELNWQPEVDTRLMIDLAWEFQRAPDDRRKIWYPG
jgi:nucleoside-diphosphate-sugar epimerase